MEIVEKRLQNIIHTEKLNLIKYLCPLCKKKFTLKLDSDELKEKQNKQDGLFNHLHIHGNPYHTVLFYLDCEANIRWMDLIHSLEISNEI